MKPYYKTRLGEIYHGDCLEIIPNLEGIDLVITDPPYSSGARQTNQLRARGAMTRGQKFSGEWFGTDNLSTAGFMFFFRGVVLAVYDRMNTGSHFYSFIDWRNYPILANVVESGGIRISNMVVWDKEIFGMGQNFRNQHELVIFGSKGKPRKCSAHNIPNVIRSKRVRSDEHPTEKPVDILRMFVEMSTEQGEIVLDCFLGSGSTAVACEKTGRRWVGIDISEKYCESAAKRIERERAQLTFDF
jgi:DNA modification methylase